MLLGSFGFTLLQSLFVLFKSVIAYKTYMCVYEDLAVSFQVGSKVTKIQHQIKTILNISDPSHKFSEEKNTQKNGRKRGFATSVRD